MASQRSYDHLLKILLIGNSGVGKSSILLRFVGEEFDVQQLSTIGVDFRVKFVPCGSKTLKLAVWDTAGQERFRTLTSSYYKGAHGIVLIYDVAERESFRALHMWLEEVAKHSTHPDAVLVLIGNKKDKRAKSDENCVSTKDGEDFAIENSMLFVETSAKTNEGIDQGFHELVAKIMESPTLLKGTAAQTGKSRQSEPQSIAGGSPLRIEDHSHERSDDNGGICGC